MDPEAQRIAIAEACGWVNVEEGEIIGKLIGLSPDYKLSRTRVPDYLNSLDAMHEAEKTLTDEQQELYAHELSQIIPQRMNCGPGAEGWEDIMVHREFDLAHATATQRAEAFLRTLGKWTT